jgi:hypothetical protein
MAELWHTPGRLQITRGFAYSMQARYMMSHRHLPIFIGLACMAAALPAHAQTSTDSPSWIGRLQQGVQQEFKRIWERGSEGVYVPLYTHHSRSGYTPEKIAELNEFTWGIGYHRTLRDESGNYRGLYAMGLSDSHRALQLQVGYTYEWVGYRIGPAEFRLGYTATIFRREDIYGGIPFPGALPLLSIGTRNFDMKFTHIPSFSKNLNNGDVTFVMVSYTF